VLSPAIPNEFLRPTRSVLGRQLPECTPACNPHSSNESHRSHRLLPPIGGVSAQPANHSCNRRAPLHSVFVGAAPNWGKMQAHCIAQISTRSPIRSRLAHDLIDSSESAPDAAGTGGLEEIRLALHTALAELGTQARFRT
jgi:hypothetical protein